MLQRITSNNNLLLTTVPARSYKQTPRRRRSFSPGDISSGEEQARTAQPDKKGQGGQPVVTAHRTHDPNVLIKHASPGHAHKNTEIDFSSHLVYE